MPIRQYFGGHGAQVMRAMQEQYGKEKGTSVFYATANKRKAAKQKRGSLLHGEKKG